MGNVVSFTPADAATAARREPAAADRLGEVVRFPVKRQRVTRAMRQRRRAAVTMDIDRLAEIARMTVLIDAWTAFGAALRDGGEAECITGGVRARVSHAAAFAKVSDLIEERDTLLCQMDDRQQCELMRKAGAAFRLSRALG